jgi:blue light- and temperature-responsive anti-repressor
MSVPYSFAFQPIVEWDSGTVFAQEALIRGPSSESAASVLQHFEGEALWRLDFEARIRAIELAAALGGGHALSLNFIPPSLELYPDAIDATLSACERAGMAPSQLILEITEGAFIDDPKGFASRINRYRTSGVRMAIDDFGAGYAGLNLLADFQPDIVKIDMGLVRDIDRSGPRQAIARGIIQVCRDLGLDVIVEGVESRAELEWFYRRGARLFQGFLIARPSFEELSQPSPAPKADVPKISTAIL